MSFRRASCVSWLALVSTVACVQAAPTDPLGATSQPVVGGVADSGDMNVVLVSLQDSAGHQFAICTGSLISPRVVMTAGHCVNPPPEPGITTPAKWAVFFTSDANTGAGYITSIPVVNATTHPLWDPNNLDSSDMSLLTMQFAAPAGVNPLPINRTALTSANIGTPFRIVGFGTVEGTTDTGAGTKRQTTSPLSKLHPAQIEFDSATHNTCHGDSGGPEFVTIGGVEVVAGVTSYGDAMCQHQGVDTRVDVYVTSFIDPYIAAHDPSGTTCNAGDGCAPGCQPTRDPDCPTTGTCAHDGVCLPNCIPEDPDCGAADCVMDGVCDKTCPLHDPDCPLAATGAPCKAGPDCTSGQCLTAPDDATVLYCTDHCDPANSACPSGMSCLAASDGSHLCVWDVTPGTIGADCTGPADCVSGLCVPGGTGMVCSKLCSLAGGPATTTCPVAYHCESQAGQGVCIPSDPANGGGGGGGCAVGLTGATVAKGAARGAGGAGGLFGLGLALAGLFVATRRRAA